MLVEQGDGRPNLLTGWAHIEDFLQKYDNNIVEDLDKDIDALLVFVSRLPFLLSPSRLTSTRLVCSLQF